MLSFLVLTAAAYGLGTVIHRHQAADSFSDVVFRFGLGTAACGWLALPLGVLGLLWAESAIALIAFATLLWQLRRKPTAAATEASPRPLSKPSWCMLGVVSAALFLGLASALTPQVHPEATAGVLADAADYARAGALRPALHAPAVSAPGLAAALFSVVFDSGGEVGAALLGWGGAVLACGMAYVLGAILAGRTAGIATAAAMATAPVFGDLSGTASQHFLFVALLLGAVGALLRAAESAECAWFWKAAFLAGSSCGVSHAGYLVCVLLLPVTALLPGERRMARAACFAGAALLFAVPWLLWLFTSGTAITDVLAYRLREDWNTMALLRYPWDLLMKPATSGGWMQSPGALVAGVGLAGMCCGGRRTAILGGFCLAGGMLLFAFAPDALDALPFFAPMWVLAGVAAMLPGRLRPLIICALTLAFAQGIVFQALSTWPILPVLTGRESREAYLVREIRGYNAIKEVNEAMAQSDFGPVVTRDPRRYLYNFPMIYAPSLHEGFAILPDAARKEWIAKSRFRYMVVPMAFYPNQSWTDVQRSRIPPESIRAQRFFRSSPEDPSIVFGIHLIEFGPVETAPRTPPVREGAPQ